MTETRPPHRGQRPNSVRCLGMMGTRVGSSDRSWTPFYNTHSRNWVHGVPAPELTRSDAPEEFDSMECVAVIACSVAVIFARLAMMQELNPFLWGFLA